MSALLTCQCVTALIIRGPNWIMRTCCCCRPARNSSSDRSDGESTKSTMLLCTQALSMTTPSMSDSPVAPCQVPSQQRSGAASERLQRLRSKIVDVRACSSLASMLLSLQDVFNKANCLITFLPVGTKDKAGVLSDLLPALALNDQQKFKVIVHQATDGPWMRHAGHALLRHLPLDDFEVFCAHSSFGAEQSMSGWCSEKLLSIECGKKASSNGPGK